MQWKIKHHELAPIFSVERDTDLIFNQILQESKNFTETENIRILFRQAGLVNLWFFLSFVASHSGPFELLNDKLHMDMCDFFQGMLNPGTQAAGFISRGHYKSTIWTKGGAAWKALRDPDSINYIFSAIEDLSMQFLHTIQRIFDGNELFAWLYPEWVPEKGSKRWNDKEGVLPNRTRYRTEPTWTGKGVGGNTQGVHGDLFFDDTVGEAQLNSERECNAEMLKTGNWLRSNIRTLKKNQNESFIFYTATRYAPNDAHAFIFEDLKEMRGYWEGLPYHIKPEGKWVVYNRMVEEDGEIIFPESISRKFLTKLREEEPWVYWTQYVNNPFHSGITELSTFEVLECELVWDGQSKEHLIKFFSAGKEYVVYLRDCYVCQACDPAASERKSSAKTSRSAVGVQVHDSMNRRYLVDLKVGYVAPSKVYEWVIANCARFCDYNVRFFLESQGPFKMMGDGFKQAVKAYNKELAKERSRKPQIQLNLRPVTASGEKVARIRTTMEPLLKKKLLYVDKRIIETVRKELDNFPLGTNDILDMWTIANKRSVRPVSGEELEWRQEREDEFARRGANYAGY